jgi:uncharacterized membrane protein YqjE
MGIGTGLSILVITLVTIETMALIALSVWVFWLATELKAMQKSTHSIQYVPADSTFQKMTEEMRQAFEKDPYESVG